MFTIRTARWTDADEIAQVVNAAFEVERPMRSSGDRTSAEKVRASMQSDTYLVAEQNKCIVGSVFVRITGTTGYFGMLAVDSAVQRGGVGRALRERAEALCKQRGCTEMTLSAGDFRTELLSYYERAGYKVVGTEPGPSEWGLAKPFKVVHFAKPL